MAGMALVAHQHNPAIELVGVQVDAYPQACAAFHQRPIEPTGAPTIADGIAVKGIGRWTMPILSRLVDDMIVVSESATEHGIALLAEFENTVVEGAGALGLAALLENRERFAGRRVGVVLSGGNIDLRLLSSILVRGLARTERVSALRVEVPDLPGALAPVVSAIANDGASIVDIVHRRTFEAASARTVSIEAVIETRDLEHRRRVIERLTALGYAVTSLT
jgi:threonine dehydratase